MGTKVEYSVNLLSATSVDSNNNLSLKSVDVWENDRNKGLSNNNNNNKGDQIGTKRLQFSMERLVDTHNLEFIRKTIQMHEGIFKHQVEELHRVYRVQKLLMDDLKKEIKQKKLWKPMNGEEGMSQLQTTRNPNGATDLDLQAHPHSMKEDVCSRDKSSGSCSAEDIIVTKISTRGFDLEMPAEEEGTLTGECEAGPSAYTDEEIELELTLSIGGSNNETYQKKKKAKPHVVELSSKLNLCGSFKSDRVGGECSDPTTPMSSSSVTFEQERRESSSSLWLARQGLKLT